MTRFKCFLLPDSFQILPDLLTKSGHSERVLACDPENSGLRRRHLDGLEKVSDFDQDFLVSSCKEKHSWITKFFRILNKNSDPFLWSEEVS